MGTKSTGSDERRIGFFMIHNGIVDSFGLTPYEGWLYVIIARHVNQKTGVAFPSLVTLAREGCMSRSQVLRCLKTLSQKGLLEITHHRQKGKNSRAANHYRLLEPPTPDAKVVPDRHQENPDLVPGRHQGSTYQVPGVVPDRHPNNTNMNKTKEQDIAAASKNDAAARAVEPKAKTPKSKTPNQLMFDAICAAFSYDPTAITKSRRGGINRTIAELLAVGATPADIPGLHAYCAREFERFGPNALSKNWPDYKASRAPRQTRNGSASAPAPKPRPDCEQCGGTGLIIAVHPDGREETVPCPDCRAAAESARKEEAIHA
jgi:hypothetical protein